MFIYRNFLLALLKGEINLSSDIFTASLLSDLYIPSNNDESYEDVNSFNIGAPDKQVIFNPFIKDGDNSLYININPIIWTNLTGVCKYILIKKGDLLVACFELPTTKHFDNSKFEWSFDNYCLKFSQI